MSDVSKKILITTEYGKYIWWPALFVVDFVRKGNRKALSGEEVHVREKDNSELGAMIAATRHMLKELEKLRVNGRNS